MSRGLLDFNRNISRTRQQFFEDQNPEVKLDELVRNSWQRCQGMGLGHREQLDFTPLNRTELSRIQDQDRQLIDCFSQVLPQYHRLIENAGYLVVLTNDRGIALTIQGELSRHDRDTRHTFRPGISFAEESIGTNAMGCAINFRREVSILGGEHYVEAITGFQCAAAPVLNQRGEVLGTVDLSRCSDRPDYGARHIARNIARQVERQLFFRQPGFLSLELNLSGLPVAVQDSSSSGVLLSFDQDGRLQSACYQAQCWLELERMSGPVQFEDIFEQSFSDCAGIAPGGCTQVLRLHSGLDVIARRCQADLLPLNISAKAVRPSVPEFGDPSIDRQLSKALAALEADLPVLISGETGTGKEVLARTLYQQSGLSGRFIALNCAAIPESLIESELFGYEEGAFTGARRGGARGKIEQADKGVLFLDEIGDMPLTLQARLLRVLETGEVNRLGGERSRISRFRLLAASHRDLPDAVHQGEFRQDLYYRIKGLNLHLPPLRLRSQLPKLVNTLAGQVLTESTLTADAMACLCAYTWPGNVRELINSLRVLRVFCRHKSQIAVSDLPEEIFSETVSQPQQGTLPEVERGLILNALNRHQGQVPEVALALGLSRATLYRKIRSYGLKLDDFRS
ncbi:sigma-54-dependent Fis family transcriptional regulator [Pontibacter sp. JAM-7]|uniref:sigma-54-dependent Fis family transcriptional regulator n=1 Tax=Pontibacter sp. JAM-7 TaxID=3366581 RepID=UPI003AF46425